MTEEQQLHAFVDEVDALAASDHFSGAMLVTRGTETVLEKTWGLADREQKIPITVDSRFRVGSVGKMFTAVAALQLIEAGRLDLSESVGIYLPDYPNRDIASKATIHHLLSHKGGTGDHLVAEFLPKRMEIATHRDWLALLNQRDQWSMFGQTGRTLPSKRLI